jgi:cobyrinic acid a,c-diamide synthase
MAALAEHWIVQGYKIGPDYIDPGYHTRATGRISRNLDSWMVPIPDMLNSFGRAADNADIAIIEGVMGLYDGYNAVSEEGSTALAAKVLKSPVVLVIDVGKMARSAGAIALGYRDFDRDLNMAGVICNRVGSSKHAQWVTEAVEGVGIPVLGTIPKSANLRIPERHLGLYMAEERDEEVEELIQTCREIFSENIDLDRIWSLAKTAGPLDIDLSPPEQKIGKVRIAVARDEAFCFYYEDNLDLLRQAGAEIVFFSPLRDHRLPENVRGVYLGGGYPELYARQLSDNSRILEDIRMMVGEGMPLYAECGGLMVLTEYLLDLEGEKHAMLGLIPGHAEMISKLVMGYRQITALQDSVLMKIGDQARGHEFHYSRWVRSENENAFAYQTSPRIGESVIEAGFIQGNLLASYIHIHFASNPDLAMNFVSFCSNWKAY